MNKVLFVLFCFSTRIFANPQHRFYRRNELLKREKRWVPSSISGGIHPSGSIPGSYYYVGSDPNYGSFAQKPNRPSSGIQSISYDSNSDLYQYLIKPSHSHYQMQQQSSNGNNRWYSSNRNSYAIQPGNRYVPGTPGWFATGGNYWFNQGEKILFKPVLYVITLMILFLYK